MHISNQLIDSFPLTYSLKSCDKEKLSIPLEAHDKAQLSEIFQVFLQKFKELYFFIFWTILLKQHIQASEIESFLTT